MRVVVTDEVDVTDKVVVGVVNDRQAQPAEIKEVETPRSCSEMQQVGAARSSISRLLGSADRQVVNVVVLSRSTSAPSSC